MATIVTSQKEFGLSQRAHPDKQELRLLLVGVEAALSQFLTESLSDGYFCIIDTARDAEEACELVNRASSPYQIALINYSLAPNASGDLQGLGIGVMHGIKARHPQTQFIIVYDNHNVGRPIEALEAGAFRYLTTPLELEELPLLIHQAAEYYRLKETEHEKRTLELLMQISTTLLDSHKHQEVLDFILQGVQSLGFDRVRLYQFNEERQTFIEQANKGMDTSFGRREWKAEEFPYLSLLRQEQRPLILKRNADSDSRFEQWLIEEGVNEWVSILMILRGRVIGKLSADNRVTGRQIKEEALKPFALFASQAAVAIENARLFADTERKARNLRSVLQVSTEVSSSLDLDHTLSAACQAAVELLAASHSGLMLFESELEQGRVVAEYPEIGTKGLVVSLRGVPVEGPLSDFKEPIVIRDITEEPSFGPTNDILLSHGIKSVMIVPVISKDRLIGSLGLDFVGYKNKLSDEEIEICRVFASQVAVAIENARLYEEVKRRAEELETLRNTSSAITSKFDRNPLLSEIIKQSVVILKAQGGGLYRYYPERKELTVIASYKESNLMGKTLKVGEGMAGQIVKSDVPFMSVDNYKEWPDRARIYVDDRLFEAVLEVPVKWEDNIIGVLYVEDKLGRKFNEEDADLLNRFAHHAAIAIASTELMANAELIAREGGKLERLEKLAYATKEIMSSLGAKTLDERLSLIAYHAAGILEAESCGVHLVKREGFLSLEASYGHREGGFQKGRSLAIRSGPKTGLTGHIASEGKLFNAHGNELIDHFAVRGVEPHHTPGKGLYSLLAIPLKKKVEGKEQLVGLLRVDNKKGSDGRVLPNLSFTKEDEWILGIFAEEVVVALESAELVDNLNTQRGKLEQLLRESQTLAHAKNLSETQLGRLLDAVQGLTTAFDLAEVISTIAGQARAVLNADFSSLWTYDKAQERVIAEEVRSSGIDGSVLSEIEKESSIQDEIIRAVIERDWICVPDSSLEVELQERAVRELLNRVGAKSFQCVALRAGDEPVGALFIYYKDLYPTKEDRRLLENFAKIAGLALKKIRLLDQVRRANESAKAIARVMSLGNNDEALSYIAQGTKEVVGCDAVTLYAYDKASGSLRSPPTRVGLRDPDSAAGYESRPNSLVYDMLWRDTPYMAMVVDNNPLFHNRRFTREEGIKSALVIPLKVLERRVGVMFINYRTPHRFTEDEFNHIWLFANQAAVVIYNEQLFAEGAKKLSEQEQLWAFSKELLSSFSLRKTLDSAVAAAAKIFHAEFCCIVLLDKAGDFIFDAAVGWKGIEVGVSKLDSPGGSQTSVTIGTKQPVIVKDYNKEERFNIPAIVFEHKIISGLSVPMLRDGKVTGAMLIHTKLRREFTDEEANLLSLIANQTAIASHSAQQYEALEKRKTQLTALYEAGKAITASFGLGRNTVLGQIIEQATICIKGNQESKTFVGTIQLYNEATNEVSIESVYPVSKYDELISKVGNKIRPLKLPVTGRVGVVGRVILDKEPRLIPDIRKDEDYIELDAQTRSELTVPLLDKDKVLGVLNVESYQFDAFNRDDLETLLALAELVVVVIKNADQYLELKRSKGLVGARTALAWMGMASSTWLHDVAKYASNISNMVMLLRRNLEQSQMSIETQQVVEEKLARIEAQVGHIRVKPIIAPLSANEGIADVLINELIKERIQQLWEINSYKKVSVDLVLTSDTRMVIRCSPEWLRHALDILVDNAIEAMATSDIRLLTINTRIVNEGIEISFIDTGTGIALDVLEKLFKAPIQKATRTKGSGMGLLIAQVIIETYGGEIRINSTGPRGTDIAIWLPLANHVKATEEPSLSIDNQLFSTDGRY